MASRFKPSVSLTENDVTDENVFNQRRQLLKSMGFVGASSLIASPSKALSWFEDKPEHETHSIDFKPDMSQAAEQTLTPYNKVTTHNNFYEFGTKKSDPVKRAKHFSVDPWTLKVDGMVNNPITLSYDDLFKSFELEERIYRLRCVEAWSMVVPWIGFELGKLISKAEPQAGAKYVAFETLYDPEQMPGQKSKFVGGGIDYPYVEGLRLDEAMHPLSLMSVGLYGKTLPTQNGAPIRLVVPWKYGFKSIKSVVRIRLTNRLPKTTWNVLAPHEYGFYANVNPSVAHPRWSQASERRITSGGLLARNRIETEMFNGYSEVAHMYKNMDLARNY